MCLPKLGQLSCSSHLVLYRSKTAAKLTSAARRDSKAPFALNWQDRLVCVMPESCLVACCAMKTLALRASGAVVSLLSHASLRRGIQK